MTMLFFIFSSVCFCLVSSFSIRIPSSLCRADLRNSKLLEYPAIIHSLLDPAQKGGARQRKRTKDMDGQYFCVHVL